MTQDQKINQIWMVTVFVPFMFLMLSLLLVFTGQGKIVTNGVPKP